MFSSVVLSLIHLTKYSFKARYRHRVRYGWGWRYSTYFFHQQIPWKGQNPQCVDPSLCVFYFLVCDSWLQLQWSVFSYKEGHKLIIIIRSLQLLDQSTERSFKTQPTEAKSNMFPELNHNSLSFSNTWWVLTCLNLQVLVFRVHLDLGFCSLLWNISRLFFTCWSLRTLWNSPPETTWCWTCRRGSYNF